MKKTGFRLIAAFFTLALAGGVTTAAGCGGSSISSLCEDICACARCTSNDLQACEDKGTKASDDAAAAGCGSEFDDAVTCAGAHVSCQSGNQVGTTGCDAELAALSKCSTTLSVFGKSPCEIAADQIIAKLKACPKPPQLTTTTSGGTQPTCTDAAGTLSLCQAAAFALASCDCIGGGDTTLCTSEQAKTFTDAFTLCK
jgi:hypothetical protein